MLKGRLRDVDPDSQASERSGEHGEQDRIYRAKVRLLRLTQIAPGVVSIR
jgi:hypothetical protein